MDWITDRQPTTEDEDTSGYVWMKRSPMNYGAATVSAAYVGPGVPWKHTEIWEPPAPATSEPESTPTPEPSKLRVGQVWRTRSGDEVTITSHTVPYPFRGSNGVGYTLSGRFLDERTESEGDLIELITDAPDPIQPEPWPLPRVFAAPIRRTFLPSGGQVLDAIADDGTCWQMFPSDTGWQQIQPLPPATEEQG